MGLSKLRELVMVREAWRAAVHGVGHDWATEVNWTEIIQEGHENCVQDVESCQMKEELDLLWGLPGAPAWVFQGAHDRKEGWHGFPSYM